MEKVKSKTKINEEHTLKIEASVNSEQNYNYEEMNEKPQAEIENENKDIEKNSEENIIFEEIYVKKIQNSNGDTLYYHKDKIINSNKVDELIIKDDTLEVYSKRLTEKYNEFSLKIIENAYHLNNHNLHTIVQNC
jgi:DNA-directed RNA polymerase alpha subunit